MVQCCLFVRETYFVDGTECAEGNLFRDEVVHDGAECQTIRETLRKVVNLYILEYKREMGTI